MSHSQLENGTNFSLRRTDLITLLLETQETLLGEGSYRGERGYFLSFKVPCPIQNFTNDSGAQR